MAAQAAPAPPLAPAPPAVPANLPPNALRGFLVVSVQHQGDFWALNGGRKTIGRASSGEQGRYPALGRDDFIRGMPHSSWTARRAPCRIEDTGSTNGTFVSKSTSASTESDLQGDGDKIRFGG